MTHPVQDRDSVEELYRSLGLRVPFAPPPPSPRVTPAPRAAERRDLSGVGAVTVVSKSHAAFARLVAEGFVRHHPGLPLLAVVADLEADEPFEVAGAEVVSAEALGVPRLAQMAFGLGMADLCCALKPFALRHAFERGLERVVYLDSDLDLHAPLAELLQLLDERELVATPHLLHPETVALPSPERPTLATIGRSGFMNAGVFAIRRSKASEDFLAAWSEIVTSPTAFVSERGGLTEQAAFNQLLALSDSAAVLRHPGYNVAYWNLHERPLRWDGADGGALARYSVGDQPLVLFHFSGYDPARPAELTVHNPFAATQHRPAVARLVHSYGERLRAAGWTTPARGAGRWNRSPSGDPISPALRHQTTSAWIDGRLDLELDPWTAAGEAAIAAALLSPRGGDEALVPPLLEDTWRNRADARAAFPAARLEPDDFLQWVLVHGGGEAGSHALFQRHRNTVLFRPRVDELGAAIAKRPSLVAGLASPLGGDRAELALRLRAAGLDELGWWLESGALERLAASPVSFLRSTWKRHKHLRRRIHDPLGAQAGAFRGWLASKGARLYALPATVGEAFERVARDGALARLFAWCSGRPDLVARWPLAFVGVDAAPFALELLADESARCVLGHDDVVAYLWLMESAPSNGVPWLFELPPHQDARPSSRCAAGQEKLLGDRLGDRRFRRALERYRERFRGAAVALEARQVEPLPDGIGPRDGGASARRSVRSSATGADAPAARSGVNLFGDPWGEHELGRIASGLAAALAAAGTETALVPCGGSRSSPPPDALLHPYRADLETNLLVAEPQLVPRLAALEPRHRWAARTAVAHLSWAQRDGNPEWPETLARFDTLWAPSSFAAAALERMTGRAVEVVPPAIEIAPPRAGDGAAAPEFLVLFLLDEPEAFHRLDPGAAAAAFVAAFRADDRARLLLRLARGDGAAQRQRLAEIERRLPDGARVAIETGPLADGEARSLLERADCFLSLHRAQAFGYRAAQAMALGKPVVATGYSGNLDYMSADDARLVSWVECDVEVEEGAFRRGARWAKADTAEAAHYLRALYEDRAATAELGRRARAAIEARLSPAAVGARLSLLLGRAANAVVTG